MNYFTSDLHLGHRVITKYRTHFKTAKEHDEYWFQKMEKLGKRDILFILGDFLFEGSHYDEYIKRIRKLKCRIKLIMGNHDSLKLYQEINQKPQSPEGSIEIQLPLYSYKNCWVTHAPIHEDEIRGKYLVIHGHTHNYSIKHSRYFNVCPEVNNFDFVNYETIKEKINTVKKDLNESLHLPNN